MIFKKKEHKGRDSKTRLKGGFQSRGRQIKKKIKKSQAERRRWFGDHIDKAGYEITPFDVEYFVNRLSAGFAFLFFVYVLALGIKYKIPLLELGIILFLTPLAGFFLTAIVLNLSFRVFVDLKKFKRKLMVEEVLPDFFQLASANIRAGMPVDKALWFAVRPRFGVLAKEIEVVAKKTLGGGKLDEALVDFANKYDSQIVIRSVNLLNEGIKAGGNVGDLLDKISKNIQEMKTLKKEMAANVTTYAIFITFAAIVAAPLLFGLSGQLLSVVQGITDDIDVSEDDFGAEGEGMDVGLGGITTSFSSEGETIDQSHYKIFVYICLIFSSVISAMIVSTIKKGNIAEGAHFIPIYILVSFSVYFVSDFVMGMVLSGIV